MQLDLDGLEFFPNVLGQDECSALVGRVSALAIDSAGSHRLGRINEADIPQVRKRFEETTCLSPRGGAIVLRPLLLHTSSKSRTTASRRVRHLAQACE